jgi:ribosome-associated protein
VTGEGLYIGQWLIPEAELEERFDTYGGPGGQHANKSETAVTLRFAIEESSLPEGVRVKLVARLGPEVEVSVSETRSQWRNRQIARDRLRERLEAALVDPRPRRKTKPSMAAREQRLTEKKARGDVKKSRRRPEGDE